MIRHAYVNGGIQRVLVLVQYISKVPEYSLILGFLHVRGIHGLMRLEFLGRTGSWSFCSSENAYWIGKCRTTTTRSRRNSTPALPHSSFYVKQQSQDVNDRESNEEQEAKQIPLSASVSTGFVLLVMGDCKPVVLAWH